MSSCVLLIYLHQFLHSFLLFGTNVPGSSCTLSAQTWNQPFYSKILRDLKCNLFCFIFQTCKKSSFFVFCMKPIHKHFNNFLLVLRSFSSQCSLYPRTLLSAFNYLCCLCIGLSVSCSHFPKCHIRGCKK